jgi:hypothetical protein
MRRVAASPDLNCGREWIEAGLEHRFDLYYDLRRG